MLRLTKKNTNSPLRIIKAVVAYQNSYEQIIKEGKIEIDYTSIKVTPWNFGDQSDQCFNCFKFGHSSRTCKAQTCCLRCAKAHNFKACKMKDDSKLKCSNCKGTCSDLLHAACSKSCPVLAKRAQIKKTHVDSLSIIRPAS